ncbi:hypothetical protein QVD17_02546 [Tagetes erecta]|uniref:Uncharacterized protein n=1 Tax=Tagetes erecta TaxID=13708 RepID=A0AAD8L9K4_TARER|nr:hypothetical protein QVD17_02546 [Tagetes erecta]
MNSYGEIALNVDDDFMVVGRKSSKCLPSFSKRHRVGYVEMEKTESATSHIVKGLKFISKNEQSHKWEEVEKRFHLLSDKGYLQRSNFGECIGLIRKKNDRTYSGRMKEVIEDNSRYFSERLFDSLCRQRNLPSGPIDIEQCRAFWDQLTDQTSDSSLKTLFDMADKDGDGRITKKELTEIISLSAKDNKLSNISKKVDEYAKLIMDELDKDNLGYITIESLKRLLFQESTHNVSTVRGESQNLSQMLSQKLKNLDQGSKPKSTWYKDLKHFLHDNWKRCWVIILWIGIMAALFTWKYIEYKQRAVYDLLGTCVCIAKGSAETLKLNMALMLLPVCRNTITWLRNKTKLGAVVPFDDNINFHQVIAVAIAIGVGLHSIAHLACDFPRLIHATEEEYAPMQQFFGDQAENYWHFLKEVVGYTGIIMLVLMTIAFTLAWLRHANLKPPSFFKKKSVTFSNSKLLSAFVTNLKTIFIDDINDLTGFNLFWYSHHLFVVVYALLIVHGIKLYLTREWYKKTTWMYLAVPILLYACERLKRMFQSRLAPAPLRKAAVYPGNVLTLQMSKPQGFKYKSGQYMFIKYADVSPFEWHPFSITSAPSDDYLSVHIRGLGDWTNQIINTFKDVYDLKEGSEKCSVDFNEGDEKCAYLNTLVETFDSIPKILIDGPYGAPAQEYNEYDVVLLVGLGIGATPMISIVKDIVNNMKPNDLENGVTLQKNKTASESAKNFKTTKAYFYWVTSEQGTFDWFRGVMNEIDKMDKKGVIEMHNYCTSVYEEGDARSAFIAMLQKIGYEKKGVDIISDTRVMSHFHKPDWPNVYKQIARSHPGSRIGVFYCGQPAVAQKLKKYASNYKDSESTTFVFHKENF